MLKIILLWPIITYVSLISALVAELLLICSPLVNTCMHIFLFYMSWPDIQAFLRNLLFLSRTFVTPEMRQPAVLFRKRLGRCKHTEPPCSLDKCLLVQPSCSIKLQRWKATLALSMATLSLQSRFLLGLVQVAGFSSKREHCNVVEKHRIHFGSIRALSKASDKAIPMSL